MKDLIKLKAEIDLTKNPAECRVKPVDDPWQDFKYYLEVTGFMLRNAAKYTESPMDNIIEHAIDHLKKAAEDYKIQ